MNTHNKTTGFSNLPVCIHKEIFSYLSPVDRIQCSQVCKLWNRAASLNRCTLLHSVCKDNGCDVGDKAEREKIRNFIVISEEEIIEKFNIFLEKFQLNNRGVFKCLFMFGQNRPKKGQEIVFELTQGIKTASSREYLSNKNVYETLMQGADIQDTFIYLAKSKPTNEVEVSAQDFISTWGKNGVYKFLCPCSCVFGIPNLESLAERMSEAANNKLAALNRLENISKLKKASHCILA